MSADSKARESSLDELYAAITELEAAITKAEQREQRMSARTSEGRQGMAERFPALEGNVR